MPRYVEDPNKLNARARGLLEELRGKGTLKMKDRLASCRGLPCWTPASAHAGRKRWRSP